jgi:hypothetical protein
MAMEISEKNRVLKEVHRRFECGRWDDLDVRLLMRIAAVAVNPPRWSNELATSVDAEFDRVAELRAARR